MPKVIRIAKDKGKVIVFNDGLYSVVNVESKQCVGVSETLTALTASGDWDTTSLRESIALAPLTAAGLSQSALRNKARQQPRDSNGRWVSAGANVRWNSNGTDWAGTVEKIVDGKAIVKVRNPDGTESQTTLLPSTLRVLASKARLAKTKQFKDPNNNFEKFLSENAPAIEAAAAEDGASIVREDGYSLDVKEKEPKGESNAYMYQLYSPGGGSLGIFGEGGKGSFDSIVSADASGVPGGTGAPSAPSAPSGVTASVDVRPYNVPKIVREKISLALKGEHGLDGDDLRLATALASGSPVGNEEIDWISEFYAALSEVEDIRGGYQGRKWASKITEKIEDEPLAYQPIEHNFESGQYDYYVVADEQSGEVNSLLAVNFNENSVYLWIGNTFEGPIASADNYDAEYIEPTDVFTARDLAQKMYDDIATGTRSTYALQDLYPEERNLFALAESEMDFEGLERLSLLSDPSGYGSHERAKNAKRQMRAPGGKFGGGQSVETTGDGTPISAPTTRAKFAVEKPLVQEMAQEVTDASTQAAEGTTEGADPMSVATYFAIVDEIDQTAVLEAVAVTQMDGNPMAYRRSGGQWLPDAEMLASLNGATPPPVVKLADVEETKGVLTQIDAHDSGKDPVVASAAKRGFALSDGSYMIFTAEDVKSAVDKAAEFTEAPLEIVTHITKRARALNRMDLVPEHWRLTMSMSVAEPSLLGEFGEVIVAAGVPGIADTPSDFAAVRRLKNYWKYGPGAAKIRWGTEGDLTRAHNLLAKYVKQPWALAQSLHIELFGKSNYKRDNGE